MQQIGVAWVGTQGIPKRFLPKARDSCESLLIGFFEPRKPLGLVSEPGVPQANAKAGVSPVLTPPSAAHRVEGPATFPRRA
jgi:hypothetical protein